jgi:hypothetical protein
MHGCELCVAIAAQRQCVLEGGLRRPREVHGTQNARGSRHGDLLQEDGRRGANLWTVARSDGALTDTAQIGWRRRFGPNGASAPPTPYRGKMDTISRRVEGAANYLQT